MRHPDTVYRGERLSGAAGEILGTVVTVDGHALPIGPSRRVRDHSPTGFEWGYGGSGPSQLALALLLDATYDEEVSTRCYHWFKWATVAGWSDVWTISVREVRAWVDRWHQEECQREAGAVAIEPYLVVEGGGHHG